MKTRITEMFGMEYPIVLPGMSWISTPELVAAVCNAGGTGWLATTPLSPEETRNSIRKTRELTDKPFGAGCSLMMPGARDNAEILLEERTPIINLSLGKGEDIIDRCHAYGGKVIQTVTTIKHSRAAERSGADALQVTGVEAAAHGSEVGTLSLIRGISEITDLPIVAAGGFGDGQGLAAALSLGADAVAMGTRLAITRESPVHQKAKEFLLDKTFEETIYTRGEFDGMKARICDTPAARRALKSGSSVIRAFVPAQRAAREMGRSRYKVAVEAIARGPQVLFQLAHFFNAFHLIKASTEDGDLENGVLFSGSVQGQIKDIPSVPELLDRIIEEARQTIDELSRKLSDS
jgi:enoyl-[acyl-carrier protein] reductase II